MIRVLTLLLAMAVLSACGLGESCTGIDAVPLVSIDVAALAPTDEIDQLQVCMDGKCISPGDSDDPLVFPDETRARFRFDGGGSDPVVLVRDAAGKNLVPPTAVQLERVYPNGPDCPGDAYQGWFSVTEDGAIVRTGARD